MTVFTSSAPASAKEPSPDPSTMPISGLNSSMMDGIFNTSFECPAVGLAGVLALQVPAVFKLTVDLE